MRFPPRYRSLDAWRGIACVAVAFHHAGFLLIGDEANGRPARWWAYQAYQHLNLGVPLFFVISGYCIAASLDAHRRRGDSAWHFLARRFWRIYPPYWAALAYFAAVVGGLGWLGWGPILGGCHALHLDQPGRLSWPQWLGNLTLTEPWRQWAFGGPFPLNLTRVSWTLGCEQGLYLVGFGLLLACRRHLLAVLGVSLALLIVGLVVLADVGWVTWRGAGPKHAWYDFAVGLAVYYRLVEARGVRGRRAVDAGLVALLALGWGGPVGVGAALGLLLIALRPWDDRAAGLAALAPLRACGLRCYSIYLAHLPVGVVIAEATYQAGLTGFWARALLTAPLAGAAGVAAGWPFYRLVEARCYDPGTAAVAPGGAADRARAPDPDPTGPRTTPLVTSVAIARPASSPSASG